MTNCRIVPRIRIEVFLSNCKKFLLIEIHRDLSTISFLSSSFFFLSFFLSFSFSFFFFKVHVTSFAFAALLIASIESKPLWPSVVRSDNHRYVSTTTNRGFLPYHDSPYYVYNVTYYANIITHNVTRNNSNPNVFLYG